MSYKDKSNPPKVYLLDLETGKQDLIGDIAGMTFAPFFSPDNKSLLMSVATNGTTGIYEINLDSKEKKVLTNPLGRIDTSPSYSPDGHSIVFNSDRDGNKSHIYIMDRNGLNIRRISYGIGSYRTPSWSPNGKWIAFTKILSGHFYTGIMNQDGTNERLVSSSWLEEGPSWSPNSKAIIFSRQGEGGENKICIIDIDSNNKRVLDTPTNGSQPSWSSSLD
jgi:TolB protein